MMDQINIEVRSPFQKMILDVLWQMDSLEQCWAFRDTLPNQAQQDICTAMINLLIAAALDRQIETEEDCETARDLISRY